MRRLWTILILFCCGCQHGSSGPAPAEISESQAVEVVKASVEEPLRRLQSGLSIRPEQLWQSIPYKDSELVVLELKHGDLKSRGEWRVSGGKATADSQFAKALAGLPESPSRGELAALVPGRWLPGLAVEQPAAKAVPKPRATPESPPYPQVKPTVSPTPKVVKKPPKAKLSLVGVMAGDIQTGFFQLGDVKFSAKPGQTVSGVTVHSVTPQTVVVTFRGKRRELYVSMPLEAQLRRPKPRKPTKPDEPETVYLDNSSLDDTPPTVLKNGVRKL